MADYRRNRVPGGTVFFSVNLLDRRSNLLVTNIDALRDSVRRVRARAPFHTDAWVVLPDHMYCLWTPAFAGAGCCRKAMAIFRVGGERSRPGSRNRCRSASRDHRP
jgi:REP element-mobilizing transposase RayT